MMKRALVLSLGFSEVEVRFRGEADTAHSPETGR